MTLVFITALVLLVYPLATWVLAKRNQLSNKLLVVLLVLSAVVIFANFLAISTTSQVVNWIILSIIPFTVYSIFWSAFYSKTKWLAIPSGLILSLLISSSLLITTIGFLGLAFVIGDFEIEYQKNLKNGYVYRVQTQGNATSDYRLKEVSISNRVSLIPFLLKEKDRKIYDDLDVVFTKFILDQSNNSFLDLRVYKSDTVIWSDRLYY